MINNYSSRKLLLIAISAVFGILLILAALAGIERVGKAPVHLSAFPSDITITINGQAVKSGTHYLEAGIYKIEARKEGFEDYEKVLVVEDKAQTLAIILNPNSEEAFEYGRNNEKEYMKVQAQGEKAAMEIGKEFNDRNPIAKHLPYKTFQYSIGYRMDQSDPSGNSIIIEIDAPEGYRQAALYRIRQLGFDPTDFTINFRDYENPFPL